MTKYIQEEAFENSTFIVAISFFDENEDSVQPSSGTWTLSDVSGNIINSRDGVSFSPDTTVNIVLSGDDLAISDESDAVRVLLIEAVYNSSLGNNLPFKEDYRFKINKIRSL